MATDEETKSKSSLDVSVGKEIDAALGDVIRGLLRKPAEEVGSLLADSIGILGDRVKRKRHLNAQLGLEDTRAILESKGVQLRDITPPDEEDLQILFDGMSLAKDEKLRRLWSGLLATALDPNEASSVERPFTTAIASMSPADARIVEFTAFVTKTNREIDLDAKRAAGLEKKGWLTSGDAERIEKQRLAMTERLTAFRETTLKMERDFQLQEIVGREDWSDNLVRLGVIRAKAHNYRPSAFSSQVRSIGLDGNHLDEIIKFVEQRIEEAEALALDGLQIDYLVRHEESKQRIILGVELTRFGEKLCAGCGLL